MSNYIRAMEEDFGENTEVNSSDIDLIGNFWKQLKVKILLNGVNLFKKIFLHLKATL